MWWWIDASLPIKPHAFNIVPGGERTDIDFEPRPVNISNVFDDQIYAGRMQWHTQFVSTHGLRQALSRHEGA